MIECLQSVSIIAGIMMHAAFSSGIFQTSMKPLPCPPALVPKRQLRLSC